MFHRYLDSPLGRLLLAGDEAGLQLLHMDQDDPHPRAEHWQAAGAKLDDACLQLDEYFQGRRRQFELRLAPRGTDFQLAVWTALRAIPYGSTCSYAELARRIGRPQAVRAVGAANGANPIAVIVPCHRVIGSNGSLTGFAGGLPRKTLLLELEGASPMQQGSLFPR